jgi:uncharacterized protein GlcG (DUF336 family)
VSIPLEAAREAVDAALAHAGELGVDAAVTVVDQGGHVVTMSRMDAAAILTVRMSADKAYTSAVTRMPTADWHPLVQPGQSLFGLTSAEAGRIITFGGGLPLEGEAGVVGAIGVAGGSVDQDVAIAEAGRRAWRPAWTGA